MTGVSSGRPIYLREVARVEAGARLPQRYVWFTPGAADEAHAAEQGQNHPAVTITVTKKPGENAVDVARGAVERLNNLKNSVIPDNVEMSITRDYGETAAAKANKLIQKLIFATGSPVDATIGPTTSVVLSPTPPDECLSTTRPKRERSSWSPLRTIASVSAAVSRSLMPCR